MNGIDLAGSDWQRLQDEYELRTTTVCKRTCCWNPFGMCGRNHQCACHTSGRTPRI